MPLLGGLLTALFTGIAEFFVKFVGRKLAAIAAGIAVMATLTGALYLLLGGLVAGIAWSMPTNSGILTGIWLFLPDNAPACMAAALSADVAIAVYRLNVLNVQFGVYAP